MNLKGMSPKAVASSPATTSAARVVWTKTDAKSPHSGAVVRNQLSAAHPATATIRAQIMPAVDSSPSSRSVPDSRKATPMITPYR